ncbi:hypothetical protein [Caproiciproducens sp.]|uniref:hypothetical protein n=1 Tax=Caproiciproducens sp. TaxID=1954376 RepID=UPI002896E515|nr:hypothetical protein [Caproiciproducens sp.]
MKKIISALMIVAMVFSFSTIAFAADAKTIGSGSIQFSKTFYQGKSNESLLVDGESSNVNILVVNTWVGATVTAKDGNLLFISGGYAGMGGDVTPYVFDGEENGGMGDNPLIIPSDWAGQTILFTNSATNDQVLCNVFDENYKPANSTDVDTSGSVDINVNSATFKSDTGARVSIDAGMVYQFKITSLNGKKPTFSVAGKSFQVTANGSKGNDYFFKVKAVGKVGDSAGVYINGQKTPSTILSITNTIKVDTGSKLTVKSGKVYQFKITASVKPTFVSGNSSVFKVTNNGNKGIDYFFKVTAIGKVGQSTGFYLNGSKTPCTVGTIG